MPRMNIVQAINMALMSEMQRDPRVVLLGEDIAKDGGVFRVTEGLYEKFPERVISTPLAESAIVGTSIGLAVYGMKPVCEIQFDGFLPPAYDQIINHVSRIRRRSQGRYTVPLVIRVPYGGGIRALEHHSDSPEVYMAHTPGIKVVIPSTPYEAKGLLLSSIRSPDPVIFFEPKKIYRAIKEEVPEEDYEIPIGKARIVQEGTDVTVLAYGSMVKTCLEALEKTTINCELIDLRTLSPLDTETIVKSVEKTGRAVIVHEAQRHCGFGAEIAALIQEKAFLHLEAPIERVTGWDIIVPLPKLEHYYHPTPERVVKAIEKVVGY